MRTRGWPWSPGRMWNRPSTQTGPTGGVLRPHAAHAPCNPMGSALVAARLAAEITAIDAELAELNSPITNGSGNTSADVLPSMPGFGPVLAATFLPNIGGNLDGLDTAGRLSSVAGLAPVPAIPGESAVICTGPPG